MEKAIHFLEAAADTDTNLPEVLAKKMGQGEWRSLASRFVLKRKHSL